MSGIYVYSDKPDIVAELVGFGRGTGENIHIIACTSVEAENCAELSADKVIFLKGDNDMVENYAKPIAELLQAEGALLFVVGATPRGRDLAARVAGYLNCGMVSDVSSVIYENGKTITKRLIYGGALVRKESFSGFGVVTVPAGIFEPSGNEKAEVVTVEVQPDKRAKIVSISPILREGVDLTAAEKIICVGMGLDKEDDMQMAKDLSQVIGAEIGCTRGVAEDRRWLPVDSYIGLSGITVKPKLLISIAVSGQIQHAVGIRDSKIIVAINTDIKAPIFSVCDYGIVGDMYEVVPMLIKALKNNSFN
ncbi:MAG: Acryloyl-CoA reductase electron transfer subunit beta [Pelotomaculum sp. PtaB.Bin104]|nr:MAG: Acryloyl-CoA reductase electron transfer subunit beta [Pelotomaculum sp. PtaB.Bin104]